MTPPPGESDYFRLRAEWLRFKNHVFDANTELRTLLLSDHGLDLYSNGLAVSEDYLARNGDVVKAFVRAGLKGWKFALSDPQKAADDQIKYVAALKPDAPSRLTLPWPGCAP